MNSVCHQSDPAYLNPTTTIALKLYNCGTSSILGLDLDNPRNLCAHLQAMVIIATYISHSVVNSLPHLEELSKENQRLTWSPGHLGTSLCNLHDSRRIVLTRHLSRVTSLKVGGLYHPSILNGLHAIIGTLPGQFPVFDEQRQAPDSHIHIQQAGRPQQFSDKQLQQLQGRLAHRPAPHQQQGLP